jgi:hypothetical protein
MSSLPPAIFFINGDISYPPKPPYFPGTDPKAPTNTLAILQTQLSIDDTMTKAEFDARVAVDPNYPTVIHLQGFRILVIVPEYSDGYASYPPHFHPHINIPNIQFADVVMFLHQGLADIEKNRFGPPGQSYEIQRLNMYELLRAVGSSSVVILPFFTMPHCNSCNYPFYCDKCHTFSGIRVCGGCGGGCQCGCSCGLIDNQGIRISNIHAPNCDNEYHNPDFINRK